jgi:rare lipoprotein A
MKYFISVLALCFSSLCPAADLLHGKASWYGPGFHGKQTANGERFNQNDLTVAHKTLPFGTVLCVTNLKTAKTIKVRVNDRGPYIKGRALDLSKKAAQSLGFLNQGTCNVSYKICD